VYVYFGVAWALQEIDVSVQNFDITFLNEQNASITTVFIIRNPSEFAFKAKAFYLEIYLNESLVADMWLSEEYINPFSNTNVIMGSTKISMPENSTEVSWNWRMSLFINLITPLPKNVPLYFRDLSVET